MRYSTLHGRYPYMNMNDIREIFPKEQLIKLARWDMPFGKYQGSAIIDLPEAYLFWFHKRGFPKGELGELMSLALELKIEGLDSLVRPLKEDQGWLKEKPKQHNK